MTSKHFVAWFATFIVMLVIDMLWLGVIAKSLYQQDMGSLLSPQPRLGIAGLFYLMYPVGLVIFAVLPGAEANSLLRTCAMGALFGLFAYGTYDLTNLAIVRDWPVGLSFIDILWGTVVIGVSATAGALALRWLAAR